MTTKATAYIAVYLNVDGLYVTNGKVGQTPECARVDSDWPLYGQLVGFATIELETKTN